MEVIAKKNCAQKRTIFRLSILLGLIVIGVFIWIPKGSKIFETHAKLQNEKNVKIKLILQSHWCWLPPEKIIDLKVSIDGKEIPVAREAYYGVSPIDLASVTITEKDNFPEIILRGKFGSPLNILCLRFLNNCFSERLLVVNHHSESKYYASPPTAPQLTPIEQQDVTCQRVVFGRDSIKKAIAKERTE